MALQGAMVAMICDQRFSVLDWAAFVCYGLSPPAKGGSQGKADPKESMGQLKMELEDLLGALSLTENKHMRPMPDVLQTALTWFTEHGCRSVSKMLKATAPFTEAGVSKTSKFELTTAGQDFQLVEALALKRGPARILLKNLDL